MQSQQLPILDGLSEGSFNAAGLLIYHRGDITAPLLYRNVLKYQVLVSVRSGWEQSQTRKQERLPFDNSITPTFSSAELFKSQTSNDVEALDIGKWTSDENGAVVSSTVIKNTSG